MDRRFRNFLSVSKTLGIAGMLAAIALVGAAPSTGAAPGANGHKSAPAETLVGGITAEEYASQMANLHGWLMKEMPAGVLDRAVVVNLTEQERGDLHKRQEAKEGPAVVGRTSSSSTMRTRRVRGRALGVIMTRPLGGGGQYE